MRGRGRCLIWRSFEVVFGVVCVGMVEESVIYLSDD